MQNKINHKKKQDLIFSIKNIICESLYDLKLSILEN